MMQSMTFKLPSMVEEDATTFIIKWLTDTKRRTHPDQVVIGDLYIPALVNYILAEMQQSQKTSLPVGSYTQVKFDYSGDPSPLYSAAWNLCRRGVLFPFPTSLGRQIEYAPVTGAAFAVTEYGKEWLKNLNNYEVLPSEFGRFSAVLAGHSSRFGSGYHTRSQEALGCYRAQLHLSCCAMCGAASESILLSLCIAKKGNEAEVLKEYGQSNGRSKLENYLLAGQNPHVHKVIPTLLEPLKYWRDNAAHGQASSIREEEAFVSMIVLMNLARFADDRWDEITASPAVP